MAVDFGLEPLGRHEARDVERDHELPDVALAARRRGEIADVAAERRAVERSRQQPDDDREATALVAAHGEIGALVDAAWIRDGRAILAVLHPAPRHRPAAARLS